MAFVGLPFCVYRYGFSGKHKELCGVKIVSFLGEKPTGFP
jgi:hypothetical protein